MSTTFFVLSFTAGSGAPMHIISRLNVVPGNDCWVGIGMSGFYLGPNFSLRTKASLYVALLVVSIFGSSSAVATLKNKNPKS
jgi:hypothetical protein